MLRHCLVVEVLTVYFQFYVPTLVHVRMVGPMVPGSRMVAAWVVLGLEEQRRGPDQVHNYTLILQPPSAEGGRTEEGEGERGEGRERGMGRGEEKENERDSWRSWWGEILKASPSNDTTNC